MSLSESMLDLELLVFLPAPSASFELGLAALARAAIAALVSLARLEGAVRCLGANGGESCAEAW